MAGWFASKLTLPFLFCGGSFLEVVMKGNVYLIKLYDTQEQFYKIGVSVHKYCRFYEIMKYGYGVNILFMVLNLDYYKAMDIERYMQSIYQSYIPLKKFGGYTECFTNILLNDYKDKITKAINANYEYIEKLDITWR